MEIEVSLVNARKSLDGLSVGDAFGELFFRLSPFYTKFADLPTSPWKWTDDTHMALSIVEILKIHHQIEQDALAKAFAYRYQKDPARGYAGGAHRLLGEVAQGANWRDISPKLFGNGSYGNGAAMRAAPIGGFFYDDLRRTAKEAELSAEVTHAHRKERQARSPSLLPRQLPHVNPTQLAASFYKRFFLLFQKGLQNQESSLPYRFHQMHFGMPLNN